MAFAQFTQWTMLNWEAVTLGAGGFKVPPPSFSWLGVSSATGVYYLTLAITAGLAAAAWNTVRSRVGRAMIAVRDSEVAAEALGVDLARTKTLAFAMSAFYAGTAGGLYSATLNYVAPEGSISSRWSCTSAWSWWAGSARCGAPSWARVSSSASRRRCGRSRAPRRSPSASC